jgi:hypothetical protein
MQDTQNVNTGSENPNSVLVSKLNSLFITCSRFGMITFCEYSDLVKWCKVNSLICKTIEQMKFYEWEKSE